MNDQQSRLIRWYRRLLLAACFLLVFWLIWRDTAPTGHLHLASRFVKPSPFVSEIVPVQRTEVVQDLVRVFDEPVYVTLRYPRPFKTAAVSFDFENPDQLFVLAGPQTSPAETYELYGLNHPELNRIMTSADWSELTTGFWQKRLASDQYSNLEQLWTDLPDQERTAYFQADWQKPYLPNFRRLTQPAQQQIVVPLQGSHRFYAATPLDTISFQADVIDTNHQLGEDALTISLRAWNGDLLSQQRLDDDGNRVDDGRLGSLRHLDFSYTGLKEAGVYEIEVETTDDVIMKGIVVGAPYAVIKGHVAIAGGPDYARAFGDDIVGPLHLRSSARTLAASTNHVDSLQTIYIGQESLIIDEPFTTATYRFPDTRRFLLAEGYDLSLERGNVSLDGSGVFAFSASAYFSPTPWLFDASLDAQTFELNYVLTGYAMPQEVVEGLYRSTMRLDLSQVFAPDKSLRFQLALPDLQPGQSLRLRGINADLTTDPITWRNVGQKLRNFIDREL